MISNFIHVKSRLFFLLLLLSFSLAVQSQDCSSNIDVEEFISARENGPVDFTIIGDSQNPFENNQIDDFDCNDLTPILTTTADLFLSPNTSIRKAYLYWSGTGEPDTSVKLNSTPITADRCWSFDYNQNGTPFTFFGSMADVTTLVQNAGNGTYTFTDMDNSSWYNTYKCSGGSSSSLLYGGWAIVVIYENPSFTNNTIFLFDGFKNFNQSQFEVNIQTNVFDDYLGSHVGTIAWEGDDVITGTDIVDVFRLNGEAIINDANDSPSNIFNGTDSFKTPPDYTFYNGDIDNYNIEQQVQQQLNTAAANFNFYLKSGQDFIILNALVMRLPNEAPDALIELPEELAVSCEERNFNLQYTYFNADDATQELPAGTPITFYLNEIGGDVVGNTTTPILLNPGEQANHFVAISLPIDYVGSFEIIAYIDDPNVTAETYGTVLELFETNNTDNTTGYIDQHWVDLTINRDLCDGEKIILGNGTVITDSGTFPFDEKTVRGGCDSTGVLIVTKRPTYDLSVPLEEVCEGNSFTKPDGEELTLEPRPEPYEFTDTLFTKNYGCDSIVHSSFLVKGNQRAIFNRRICEGDGFELNEGEYVFETGQYEVIKSGFGTNGCDSIITYNLNVLDVVYPNAFTPDNNGVNDGFKAILPDICPDFITEYHLQIFNRWGQLVFETNNVRDPWLGNFEEHASQTDFYVWYAEYTTRQEKKIKKEGGVTLIR